MSGNEFTEKLKYIHRNPVKRGMVIHAADWKWSSFRRYFSGEDCGVEVECWRNPSFPTPT